MIATSIRSRDARVDQFDSRTVRQGYFRPSRSDAFSLNDSEQVSRRYLRIFQDLGKEVSLSGGHQLITAAWWCTVFNEPLRVRQRVVRERWTSLKVIDRQKSGIRPESVVVKNASVD